MKNDNNTEQNLLHVLRMILPLAEAYVKIAAPGPDTQIDTVKLEIAREAMAAAEDKAQQRAKAEEQRKARRTADRSDWHRLALLIAAAVIYAQLGLKAEETNIVAAQVLAVEEAESLLTIIEERGDEQ